MLLVRCITAGPRASKPWMIASECRQRHPGSADPLLWSAGILARIAVGAFHVASVHPCPSHTPIPSRI
ncbi:MAG TPA: hypothetical protein DCP73_13110 [Chloroflexi bacterium]|nr:hypothetical protein [Chloroflexota bacterium]